MRKIERVIDSCNACRYCYNFKHGQEGLGTTAVICGLNENLIGVVEINSHVDIPDWCPLETYMGQEDQHPVASAFAPPTVRLCGLEWMTEPLTGHGGTEVDGRTYYTQDEAIAAAEQIGHGWRLPTKEEHVALAALGSTWVDKGPNGVPGRWFGGNHDTDHEGSVFYEASGYRASYSGGLRTVGTHGFSWSSSPYSAPSVYGSHLNFNRSGVGPEYSSDRETGFPVRCVREIKINRNGTKQDLSSFAPPTVRLCGLEWMSEPLTGFGGTEVDGRTYYTQDEAIAAAEQIGHGWRLPTKEEHVALAALGSTWVDKGPNGVPGRWFGGNHDTDHEGSVFYEASGYRDSYSGGLGNVGTSGYSWSSSPYSASSVHGSNLYFRSGVVNPEGGSNRASGFPVRCVREIE